jgi:hypothetical protein
VSGTLDEHALLKIVQRQHRERHAVTATVVHPLREPPANPDPPALAAHGTRSHVMASWRAPDGSRHHDTLATPLSTPRTGQRFTLWTDAHGAVVARPLDPAAVTTHAILAGLGAAIVLAALVEGVRRLVMWRIVRRRYACWDREWQQAGPDWGRTGTGC